MNIPKKVKILGVTFKIKVVKEGAGILPENHMGLTRTDKNTIYLKSDSSVDSTWQTLWHEMYHAMNTQLSEEQVEWLANATYGLLKENKWLKD